jgi:Flp pilus assembly protein TadD
MTPAAQNFLDQTPLTALINISPALLQDCAAKAYEFCQSQNYTQAQVLARGLVAADHRDWYYRTLLAVCLQKLGRTAEAIEVVDQGLRYCPGQPDLLALRAAL